VRRREFITALGGVAAAWPLAASAQQTMHVRRVGVFMAYAENDPEARDYVEAFNNGMKELRWTEGRDIRIDFHWATGDVNRMRSLAKQLVEQKPDVIVSNTTPVTATLLRETRTIPVVFVIVSDPVGSGFVAGLSHPGGNATGFINVEASMATKWLELVKETAPSVTRVALLFNPTTAPYFQYYQKPFEAAARSISVEPLPSPVRDLFEIETVMAMLTREPKGGLVIMTDSFMLINREPIVSLVDRYGLTAVYASRSFATSGGLIAYGPNNRDLFRRAAGYVDRILKGEKPTELPVQVPTKFELFVNLKTAKSQHIIIPQSILIRADEVIE
jgi:putative tryptophan/tyrosine transport system substrate-binding protein